MVPTLVFIEKGLGSKMAWWHTSGLAASTALSAFDPVQPMVNLFYFSYLWGLQREKRHNCRREVIFPSWGVCKWWWQRRAWVVRTVLQYRAKCPPVHQHIKARWVWSLKKDRLVRWFFRSLPPSPGSWRRLRSHKIILYISIQFAVTVLNDGYETASY